MVQQVTEGVSIMVETFYQPAESRPLHAEHFFAYRITIRNLSACTMKLVSRHWHIYDSIGTHREVEGQGVVGEQPTIFPGDEYQYTSAVNLQSEIGKMYGTYLMESRKPGGKRMVTIDIPVFMLVVPSRLN